MTKIQLFSILTFSLFVLVKASGQTADTFNIQTLHFKTDTNIISVACWHDNFYCLKSNGNLFIIDSLNNLIDLPNSNNSFIYIYTLKDTLFGLTLNGSIFTIHDSNSYFYNKSSVLIDIPFFEDEAFKVEETCSGEYGGSVYFIDKNTGKKYECSATCPSYIRKLNSVYYVIANLHHGIGFGSSEIIKIEDPRKLKEYKRDRVKKKYRYVGYDESGSTQGSQKTINTSDRETIMSFPYNGVLYHIVNNSEKTYICRVENNHLVTLSLISETGLSAYNRYEFLSKDYPFLISFDNYKANGFLSVKGNLIKKYLFEKE